MTLDDIDTEARRLGELETAFIRQANEIVALRNRCESLEADRKECSKRFISVWEEMIELSERVYALEVWHRPWWRRWL